MLSTKPLITSILSLSLLSSATAFSPPNLIKNQTQAASVNQSAVAIPQDRLLPLKWQVATDGTGMYDSHLPIMNRILYFSEGNTLYAKNITTGKTLWSYKGGAHPQIVTNNSVFFIDNHQQLVKLSALTGKLIWKVKVSERPMEVGGQARLINGKVYFANESGGVAAYHPVTGKKLWENKDIPMYTGSIYGEYSGVFVVSSTVDNIRVQFFGIDTSTGKRLWRTEGMYSYISYENGKLLLREQPLAAAGNTAVPGYQLALVKMNPATGKLSGRENYSPLTDISGIGAYVTSIHKPYVYSVDHYRDKDEYILTRFVRGEDSKATPVSYQSFGNWLAGPADGMAFFQQGTSISGINLADSRVVTFENPAWKVMRLQSVGKAVFAIYENGYISVNHAETGALLGLIKSGATYPDFGSVTLDHGIALIRTEHNITALTLPIEYQ